MRPPGPTFRIKIQFIEFLCENSHILSPPPCGGGLANMRLSRSEGGCDFMRKVDPLGLWEPSSCRN